jgi:hypothetical protein
MRTDKREELAAFTVDCLAETLAAHGRGTSGSSSSFPADAGDGAPSSRGGRAGAVSRTVTGSSRRSPEKTEARIARYAFSAAPNRPVAVDDVG